MELVMPIGVALHNKQMFNEITNENCKPAP